MSDLHIFNKMILFIMVRNMEQYNGIKIIEAKNFKTRLLGFMFKKNINYGLLFKNCRSIHTFFMKEKIDVILADKEDNIIKIYKSLEKNKIIIGSKKVKNIYELPNGIIK